VGYEKGMTHNDSQTMRPCKPCGHNGAMQHGRANHDPQWHTGHAAKNAKGEGVGPTAKGQQKRSVHEQFFFLQNFYFLL